MIVNSMIDYFFLFKVVEIIENEKLFKNFIKDMLFYLI